MSALARIAANVDPVPDDAEPKPCGKCPAIYLDYALGRDAHEVVFGHPPE